MYISCWWIITDWTVNSFHYIHLSTFVLLFHVFFYPPFIHLLLLFYSHHLFITSFFIQDDLFINFFTLFYPHLFFNFIYSFFTLFITFFWLNNVEILTSWGSEINNNISHYSQIAQLRESQVGKSTQQRW